MKTLHNHAIRITDELFQYCDKVYYSSSVIHTRSATGHEIKKFP